MEVSLDPGRIVLDGDPAPPPKGAHQLPLLFGPCLLWPNGWITAEQQIICSKTVVKHSIRSGLKRVATGRSNQQYWLQRRVATAQ